ncbi:MAG: adenylate/guanylate cyclase domain-containing protein [Paracoccaceae bacterium]
MNSISDLNTWLISEARLLGDASQIVDKYCTNLRMLGIPVSRARVAQRYSNPLLSAWGIIWTPDNTHKYVVPVEVLSTSAWEGSPFEFVLSTRQVLRKRLVDLDLSHEHIVYRELADAGATDFLAMPLEYGDGSAQGSSFVTDAPEGFSEAQVADLQATRYALAAALEPIAMRESQRSLLETYLGRVPASEVGAGRINRGEHKSIEAAILFADLRGYTAKTETWSDARLLSVLGDFFDMVVTPIQAEGGDVLKFMGDGVLAMFASDDGPDTACQSAVKAAQQALKALDHYNAKDGGDPIAFVIGMDFGTVTLGNIGSPDRLDFTVIGPAVNVASRVQNMCKSLDERALVTANVAQYCHDGLQPVGGFAIRGVVGDVELSRISSEG